MGNPKPDVGTMLVFGVEVRAEPSMSPGTAYMGPPLAVLVARAFREDKSLEQVIHEAVARREIVVMKNIDWARVQVAIGETKTPET